MIKWLRYLKSSERGQASLEYAGMIAAAGILIAVIIGAAQGWGDTLVCKISGAISGGNAGCSASVSANSAIPDKVLAAENSMNSVNKIGGSFPIQIFNVGGDYQGKQKMQLKQYSDGSYELVVENSDGLSLNGSVGKDLDTKGYGVTAELSANAELGGSKGETQVYRCQAGQSGCIEALKKIADEAQRTHEAKGLEHLTDKNGNQLTVAEDWKYWQVDASASGKAKFGNKIGENSTATSVDASAAVSLSGNAQWAEDSVTGNKKHTVSGTFDAKAAASLGTKSKAKWGTENGTENTFDLKSPSLYAGAGYKGAFQIVTERDAKGEPLGIKLITTRDMNANAGISMTAGTVKSKRSGATDPSRSKFGPNLSGKHDFVSSAATTTTTLKLKDIKDPALRAKVKAQINSDTLSSNPVHAAQIIANGGIYESDPGADNPVAKALYQHGVSTTQTFATDKNSGESGMDLILVHSNNEWSTDNRKTLSTHYLSEPDSAGKRHVETYNPKP